MSYSYELAEQHQLLLAILYGPIDEDELREAYLDIRRRKDENHALTGIMDLTRVTKFDVRTQFIRELAGYPPIIADPTLRAVVAPTDLLFGMARMFEIIGSQTRQHLHIVRTLDDALILLDAQDAQFRRLRAAS
jgi:hypothetical protein